MTNKIRKGTETEATEKELICVNCPMGCRLTVRITPHSTECPDKEPKEAGGTESGTLHAGIPSEEYDIEVTGNRCPRGKAYAEKECIRPERILTTTVKIRGGSHRVLPVITDREIPLDCLMQAMDVVRTLTVEAPIREGDVITENLLGTGANLIASRSMTSSENVCFTS